MEYLSKKQSWLDFINESMGNDTKDKATGHEINRIESTEIDNNTYAIRDSDSKSLHNTNLRNNPSAPRIQFPEKSNNTKKNRQQNVVANRK
jgi:hypothetical protein